MTNKNETDEPVELQASARELAHHLRYLGTRGFKNPDGSARVPTEQEVVDHGWEPQSYLTSPIPPEPRHGLCSLGKTTFLDRQPGRESDVIALLEKSAEAARAARVAAATEPPQPWRPMLTAPKDGTLLDVLFDVATAEAGMAEFYAPGCSRKKAPVEPIIENVAFVNGNFATVIDADGARMVANINGGWGDTKGSVAYAILSVSLTHWRPAAFPYIE